MALKNPPSNTVNPGTHEVKHNVHHKNPYRDFICGMSAGCIETCILYPQNKLIFRQQLLGVVAKDAVSQVTIL